MSQNKKFEKNILRLYRNYSDEEIYNMVLESLPKYIKLIKSEEIAKEILKKYNLTLYYDSRNERVKMKYIKLMICAHLKKIMIPEELFHVEITIDDIIKRITENKLESARLIDEYCYKWDGYCGNGLWNIEEIIHSNEYDGANIRQKEIYKLYNNIIHDVKKSYEAKQLVLTKK